MAVTSLINTGATQAKAEGQCPHNLFVVVSVGLLLGLLGVPTHSFLISSRVASIVSFTSSYTASRSATSSLLEAGPLPAHRMIQEQSESHKNQSRQIPYELWPYPGQLYTQKYTATQCGTAVTVTDRWMP